MTCQTNLFRYKKAIIAILILLFCSAAEAEIWRCTSPEGTIEYRTETPSKAEQKNCQQTAGGGFVSYDSGKILELKKKKPAPSPVKKSGGCPYRNKKKSLSGTSNSKGSLLGKLFNMTK